MNNLHVMFYVNGLTRYVILPPIIIRANINFVLLLAQLFIQLVASTPDWINIQNPIGGIQLKSN